MVLTMILFEMEFIDECLVLIPLILGDFEGEEEDACEEG